MFIKFIFKFFVLFVSFVVEIIICSRLFGLSDAGTLRTSFPAVYEEEI